jgi:late competence protein required for DNA uptake (superfamily II DNA/RNA helicase)
MAGRAGRTTEHPTGKVYFLGERVSFAMKETRRLIEAQNSLAFKQGFIRRVNP